MISDAHTGLKAAIARVFEATWQRCRVHWMRNALAHVSRGQHTVVAAAIRQAFEQPDRKHASETWHKVAEQLRPCWPKLADLMDASEHDVLAYMTAEEVMAFCDGRIADYKLPRIVTFMEALPMAPSFKALFRP